MEGGIAFLGAGVMGGAMIRGLAAGQDRPVSCYDLNRSRVAELAAGLSVDAASSPEELLRSARDIFLAVKPQQMEAVLRELAPHLHQGHCVVSIAAGVRVERLRAWSGGRCAVIRVMPNTPAAVGKGCFALCLDDPALTEADAERVAGLLKLLGSVFVMPEEKIDAFTALVGSGPAYVVYFMEALVDAGVTMGIPREEGRAMVEQLVDGVLSMSRLDNSSLADLRQMVCSPGGTTIAALNVFDCRAVRGSLIEGVLASWRRSRELAG